MATPLVKSTDRGLFCEAGGFYIDPWLPVDKALVTHAHSDHARSGSGVYLCAAPGERVLQHRVGALASIQTLPYGEQLRINDVIVSFHPAGHILGSAQIRIEHKGEVWVISGDYKLDFDPTCEGFEPVKCNTFITESTFGLPIYSWPSEEQLFAEINTWWQKNSAEGKTSLLLCYALGKAQRLLTGVDASIAPILTHGAVEAMTEIYRLSGVALPHTKAVSSFSKSDLPKGSLVLAPPSAYGTAWQKKLSPISAAFASGWMRVRGIRRRRSLDKGFVVSDHSDWPSLIKAVKMSCADNVLVTHGYAQTFVRYLRDIGLQADLLSTHYEGEGEDESGSAAHDGSAEDEGADGGEEPVGGEQSAGAGGAVAVSRLAVGEGSGVGEGSAGSEGAAGSERETLE